MIYFIIALVCFNILYLIKIRELKIELNKRIEQIEELKQIKEQEGGE